MTFTFHGLKTCDTCRKARKALDAAGVDYAYKDVRADGMTANEIRSWADRLSGDGKAGWERLLNKSSTTWRALPDADKENLDAAKAIALLAAHPTLIKRPVIANGTDVWVGWTADVKDAVIG